jgi:hypothetical protein
MSTVQIDSLPASIKIFPADSRIWLFGLDASLENGDMETVAAHLNRFIDSWQSHGREVKGTFAVIESRFLLIVAHAGVSGCSTDDLMRTMRKLQDELGIVVMDGLRVFYRDERGAIRSVRRPDFLEMIRDGGITAETPVFDLSLTSLGQLQTGAFERPLKDSVFRKMTGLLAAGENK